ncbi:MAG TPA: helix-turn-helix transcriptional regulator [Streptosporangiaceae bacterium]|nr:helix-turn-helix transcriptional regulator [Streptosporangiaceae bacterium]
MRDLLAFGQSQRQQGPSPLLRTIVGGVLRRTRLSQRRTLADVAASARISMQYLSELERGRKEASSEILAALCAALQIDLSELLAAVGHDLLDQRRRRPGVVRIGAFRDGAAPPASPQPPPDRRGMVGSMRPFYGQQGSNDALPLDRPADSAAESGADGRPADGAVVSESPAGDQSARGDLSSPVRGAQDAVCRLAA